MRVFYWPRARNAAQMSDLSDAICCGEPTKHGAIRGWRCNNLTISNEYRLSDVLSRTDKQT